MVFTQLLTMASGILAFSYTLFLYNKNTLCGSCIVRGRKESKGREKKMKKKRYVRICRKRRNIYNEGKSASWTLDLPITTETTLYREPNFAELCK